MGCRGGEEGWGNPVCPCITARMHPCAAQNLPSPPTKQPSGAGLPSQPRPVCPLLLSQSLLTKPLTAPREPSWARHASLCSTLPLLPSHAASSTTRFSLQSIAPNGRQVHILPEKDKRNGQRNSAQPCPCAASLHTPAQLLRLGSQAANSLYPGPDCAHQAMRCRRPDGPPQ